MTTVSTAAIGTSVLAALDGLGLRITGVDALIDHVERQIVGEAWSMESDALDDNGVTTCDWTAEARFILAKLAKLDGLDR